MTELILPLSHYPTECINKPKFFIIANSYVYTIIYIFLLLKTSIYRYTLLCVAFTLSTYCLLFFCYYLWTIAVLLVKVQSKQKNNNLTYFKSKLYIKALQRFCWVNITWLTFLHFSLNIFIVIGAKQMDFTNLLTSLDCPICLQPLRKREKSISPENASDDR